MNKKRHERIITKAEYSDFINTALHTDKQDPAKIGFINESIRQRIKEKTNCDVAHIEVDMGHIRHIINKEAHNVDTEDVLLMPEVVNNAEYIIPHKHQNRGTKVIEIKTNLDGYIHLILGIHNKGDGYVSPITYYRPKKKAQHGSDGTPKVYPGANVQNEAPSANASLSHTSGEKSSNFFENSDSAL